MLTIAPSILAADWGRLHEEVQHVVAAGADWIHLDVMDGHFVPPITFGPQMVKAVRETTSLPLDVHLMIERPEQQIKSFHDAGADIITVHYEACPHLHRTIQQIHELGGQAGVCINPATPVSVLEQICADVDLILVMTVNPGWGGQAFISTSPAKISQAAALIKQSNRKIHLEVDGGINNQTAYFAAHAGADVLVAGTYIFDNSDYQEQIAQLKKAGSI
jgi:ribulose-phosphate 3-epimerase